MSVPGSFYLDSPLYEQRTPYFSSPSKPLSTLCDDNIPNTNSKFYKAYQKDIDLSDSIITIYCYLFNNKLLFIFFLYLKIIQFRY